MSDLQREPWGLLEDIPVQSFAPTSEESKTRDGEESHDQIHESRSQYTLPHHGASAASPGCPVLKELPEGGVSRAAGRRGQNRMIFCKGLFPSCTSVHTARSPPGTNPAIFSFFKLPASLGHGLLMTVEPSWCYRIPRRCWKAQGLSSGYANALLVGQIGFSRGSEHGWFRPRVSQLVCTPSEQIAQRSRNYPCLMLFWGIRYSMGFINGMGPLSFPTTNSFKDFLGPLCPAVPRSLIPRAHSPG